MSIKIETNKFISKKHQILQESHCKFNKFIETCKSDSALDELKIFSPKNPNRRKLTGFSRIGEETPSPNFDEVI